ncbi:hypothetical protein [Hymenobacter terricola]|uniref:hypothetical protein n=1 Tax=Hymenobacter terricola TaxID=2819236 RepID=UPI001B313545|nr:hypothetical protein [Hymenobacter terricola]
MRHLEYTQLFRDLATRHVDIRHGQDGGTRFLRILLSSDPIQRQLDLSEFQNGLKNRIKLAGGLACLVLENYEADYTDNDGDYYARIHRGAFLVLKLTKTDDFDGRDQAIDDCERIGEDLLGAFIRALRGREVPLRITANDIMGECVGPVGDNFYGCRYSFTYASPATEDLTFNPDKFTS